MSMLNEKRDLSMKKFACKVEFELDIDQELTVEQSMTMKLILKAHLATLFENKVEEGLLLDALFEEGINVDNGGIKYKVG